MCVIGCPVLRRKGALQNGMIKGKCFQRCVQMIADGTFGKLKQRLLYRRPQPELIQPLEIRQQNVPDGLQDTFWHGNGKFIRCILWVAVGAPETAFPDRKNKLFRFKCIAGAAKQNIRHQSKLCQEPELKDTLQKIRVGIWLGELIQGI